MSTKINVETPAETDEELLAKADPLVVVATSNSADMLAEDPRLFDRVYLIGYKAGYANGHEAGYNVGHGVWAADAAESAAD